MPLERKVSQSENVGSSSAPSDDRGRLPVRSKLPAPTPGILPPSMGGGKVGAWLTAKLGSEQLDELAVQADRFRATLETVEHAEAFPVRILVERATMNPRLRYLQGCFVVPIAQQVDELTTSANEHLLEPMSGWRDPLLVPMLEQRARRELAGRAEIAHPLGSLGVIVEQKLKGAYIHGEVVGQPNRLASVFCDDELVETVPA